MSSMLDCVNSTPTHWHTDREAQEIWDVVDINGRSVGRTTKRGAPSFAPGEFHIVVGTCVFTPRGEVLVTRRAPNKTHPGKWEFSAGSALTGESSVEAARRELAEETGLEFGIEEFQTVGRLVEPIALFDIYAVQIPTVASVTLQAGEVDDYRWVDLDAVLEQPREVAFTGPWNRRIDQIQDVLRKLVEG
ncbi:NUDIX domain-containing protein [Gulosibacter molinativorax]|uniref:NUDIX domain-containing protein n=1 Tax=Gulosibacter molinativorax TaxID=256821 RepID=A0ABT7CBD6_9MICO|nr:NUDIX domain-containing protein [Gulosibacter molinativorax]